MANATRGRGHLTSQTDRENILTLINDAVSAGCRKDLACEAFNLEVRTLQRWKIEPVDKRRGPITSPKNKLSVLERNQIIKTSTSLEFVNQSPHQIVPCLADQGIYLASEASFYRILKAEKLNVHRGHAKPRIVERPQSFEAQRPNQIYSWDITYLQSCVRGQFYYLYLFLDLFSREIVGWNIHHIQDTNSSAALLEEICITEKINKKQIILHSDNGGPMKGATMLATMQRLGVVPSFSRPSVSNDNPFSESMFRTLKYCSIYPSKPFDSIKTARLWMTQFEKWYNDEHLHSGINFVTPNSKHAGLDVKILKSRSEIYENAKLKNPNRWSGKTRNWDAVTTVKLNPLKEKIKSITKEKLQLAS